MEYAQYPERYQIQDAERQLEILRMLWPSLDTSFAEEYVRDVLPGLPIPKGAEGLFCIVNPAFFGERHEAVQEILKTLSERAGRSRAARRVRKKTTSRFVNELAVRHKGKLDADSIRVRTHTDLAERAIALHQPGDVWVIPAQFGRLHRTRSATRVRERILDQTEAPGSEFGLGIAAVGCMTLLHPNRFTARSPLQAECMGDRVAHSPLRPMIFRRADEKEADFRRREAKSLERSLNFTPFFGVHNRQLILDAFDSDFNVPTAGVVTGFVPYH